MVAQEPTSHLKHHFEAIASSEAVLMAGPQRQQIGEQNVLITPAVHEARHAALANKMVRIPWALLAKGACDGSSLLARFLSISTNLTHRRPHRRILRNAARPPA